MAEISEAETPGEPEISSYAISIERFNTRLRVLRTSTPRMMGVVLNAMKAQLARMNHLITTYVPDNGEQDSLRVLGDKASVYFELDRELEDSKITIEQLPLSALVSLVSEFDFLVGALITAMLRDKPAMLNSSEKRFTLAELVNLGNLESARNFMIEKEVESVLRTSHVDQFAWLEAKLGISLRTNLLLYGKFVEITERRNLLVHTNSIASTQYIANCKKHSDFEDSKVKPGDKLETNISYFRSACDVLQEIGNKLAQVIWRKMRPHETDQYEEALVGVTFNLIVQKRYRCAQSILEFFVIDRKNDWADEEHKMLCKINLSQCYKWQNESDKCRQIIADIAPSMLASRWQLALYVLKDDFEAASRHMAAVNSANEIRKADYREWPIFQEFRRSDAFKKTFHTIYGQAFDDYVAEHTAVQDALRTVTARPAIEDKDPKQAPT